jgi:Domain of unknown function (DUF5348)
MSKSVGTLDYRSDHYWVVDLPGQDDYELQAGDSVEVLIETHWLCPRVLGPLRIVGGDFGDFWIRTVGW